MVLGKEFLTVEEQINCLVSKGLTVKNKKNVTETLFDHSYYDVINGYSDPFCKSRNPRQYKTGSSFDEIYALYTFDVNMRWFLLKYILRIEETLKTKVVYSFSGAKTSAGILCNQRDAYLTPNSYDASSTSKSGPIDDLIKSLKDTLAVGQQWNDSFQYYQAHYHYVPLWVLATNMTFGGLSRFYECMPISLRSEVAKEYGLFENDLRTMLKVLTLFRNCCAHGGRFYSFKETFSLPNIKYKGQTIIPENGCQKKFGGVLLCLKILLGSGDFTAVRNNLNNELQILSKKLHSISVDDIVSCLGITPKMRVSFGIKTDPVKR